MTAPDLAWRGFVLLLGPFAGDYAATLAAAWPRAPRPIIGRSRCARCGKPIAAWRQLPLASFALLRGRRGCCDGRIPLVYPLGEAAGLASGLAAAAQAGPLTGGWTLAVGLTLAYTALVDLRRFSIPLAGLAGLGLETALDMVRRGDAQAALARLATGGALALLLETLRRLVRPGGRAGLGVGDVLLAGGLGALVGWRLAAPMVSLAAVVPLGVQLFTGRPRPVAFGFWLCLAAAAVTAARFALASLGVVPTDSG